MSIDPQYHESARSPVEPPPIKYAGQWIAWNKARTEIIAHGSDLVAVHAKSIAAGHTDAILQRVRDPKVRFIGST